MLPPVCFPFPRPAWAAVSNEPQTEFLLQRIQADQAFLSATSSTGTWPGLWAGAWGENRGVTGRSPASKKWPHKLTFKMTEAPFSATLNTIFQIHLMPKKKNDSLNNIQELQKFAIVDPMGLTPCPLTWLYSLVPCSFSPHASVPVFASWRIQSEPEQEWLVPTWPQLCFSGDVYMALGGSLNPEARSCPWWNDRDPVRLRLRTEALGAGTLELCPGTVHTVTLTGTLPIACSLDMQRVDVEQVWKE